MVLFLSHYPFGTIKSQMLTSDNRSTSLLLRGGYIRQELAGVYSYLPLGHRVLTNIARIVTRHLEALGAYQVTMPSIGAREHREATGRTSMDVLFALPFAAGKSHVLNPTHEEIVTPLISEFVSSHKDLPLSVFQIQTKFRNEWRAKSGLLRGREFVMSDMYSFHASHDDLRLYYDRVLQAYHEIFAELGVGDMTYLTYASGGDFSSYSHEFQTVLDVGEDTIYLDKQKKLAINSEIIDQPSVQEEFADYTFESVAASEIGNNFMLGTRFADAFGATYTDAHNQSHPIFMGCYGIGISRAMGIIAEACMDEHGLCWPASIAPYQRYIIQHGEEMSDDIAQVVRQLEDSGQSVIVDDRALNFGAKARDADLLGIPHRLVISPKSLAAGGYEYKKRTAEQGKIVSLSTLGEIVS